MSQNKLAKLRNTDVFKALMRVLDEYRIPKEDFDVLDKRPHPMLTVRYCGVEREMSIPSTPKTKGKAPVAYSSQLRRLLKEMQMESLGGSFGEPEMTQQSNFSFDDDNSPIVFVKNGKVFANSRDVAEYFDKRHDHVLRDIGALIQQGVPNFGETPYTHPQNNQIYRSFDMSRDAFSLLAMGFTGPRALQFKLRYIAEFNAMEAKLREHARPIDVRDPSQLASIALQLIELNRELECRAQAAEATVANQAPKVEALERIAEADGSLCITDAAKNLQVQPQRLFKWLDTNGWTYIRPGTSTRLAYQTKLNAGYLEHKVTTKPKDDGSERVFTQVRVTPKGLAYLAEVFPPIVKGV